MKTIIKNSVLILSGAQIRSPVTATQKCQPKIIKRFAYRLWLQIFSVRIILAELACNLHEILPCLCFHQPLSPPPFIPLPFLLFSFLSIWFSFTHYVVRRVRIFVCNVGYCFFWPYYTEPECIFSVKFSYGHYFSAYPSFRSNHYSLR